MQLIKINALETQPPQATFAGGSQVFRPSIFDPLVGTRALEPSLGGDHQAGRIGVQGLGYDFFADARTVGVGGVDKIDPQFDGAPQDADGLISIGRLAPNSISREPHCSETQSRNTEIVSNHEFAGFSGKLLFWMSCRIVLISV